MEPDLVASGGLSVKLKAERPQLLNDLPVSIAGQSSHSGRDDDRVVSPLTGRRQVRSGAALAPRFYDSSRNIARDFERFRDSPPLRDKAGEFFRGRKEQPLRQFFDMYLNRQFHTS